MAVCGLAALAWPLLVQSAASDSELLSRVEAQDERAVRIARSLWDWSELGYREQRSTALLQSELAASGFAIQMGLAGIPTAFVAEVGSGHPVVAILAEFDALPGISQAAVPRRRAREARDEAQACGHNLFAGGSVAAAIAVADWLRETERQGTIRLYGTPAEEGGSGKVYLVRAGLFDDVDVALHWHPSDRNDASALRNLANKSAKFRFHGEASHAALAPERGRSALDGVEAMNFMVNLLREHVPQETRIHYVISQGGQAPNVVPSFAEVFYYVRHPEPEELSKVWSRVVTAAQAAALGTGTEMDLEVIHGNHSLLPNLTVSRRMYENARLVGGPRWSDADLEFAGEMQETLPEDSPGLETAAQLRPFETLVRRTSTDVGDVSWMVPTAGLWVATWPPGTASHTWQAAAASGAPIGEAGMRVAARVLALTAADFLRDPELVTEARRELEAARGSDFEYAPLLGDREPPLDYRHAR